MLEIFGKCTRRGKVEEEKAVAVEVEPSKPRASGGHNQLRTYVTTGHFDFGVLVCPSRVGDEKSISEQGYITWDDENKEIPYFPEISYRKEDKLNELLMAAKKLVSLIMVKNFALLAI